MGKIKNIIFDLGGVLLNIDYNLTSNAFKNIGIKDFDQIYSQLKQSDVFDQFEMGNISASEFRKQLMQYSSNPISEATFDSAWNAMLLDFPKQRIELLSGLKTKYQLFLLSNTNEIHMAAFELFLDQTFGFKSLRHLFEKVYFSFEIGYRKPNADAFSHVLSQNDLIAQETLFIDDSPQHIQGARKLGIHAFLLNNLSINQLFSDSFELHSHFTQQTPLLNL